MPKRLMFRNRVREVSEQLSARPPKSNAEARELALTAHALAIEADDRLLEAEALLNFGKLHAVSPSPQQMLSSAQRAEQIFRAHGRTDKVGACLVMAARALFDMGEESNAMAVLQATVQAAPLTPEDRAHAAILKSMCFAQLGNTATAARLISDQAVPLARASGQPFFVMLAKSALCLLHLRVLLATYTPGLWAGMPGTPTPAEPVTTPAILLALLHDAEAELRDSEPWDYLSAMRHVVHALAEPRGTPGAAFEALQALAEQRRQSDPALALWAMSCGVCLLLHHADWESAQAYATDALELAEALQIPFLTRELLRLHVWACEAAGDLPQALSAQKRMLALWLKSVIQTVPSGDAERSVMLTPATDTAVPPPTHLVRSLQPLHVRRALRFIDEADGVGRSVSDVVRHCGVSRRTLQVAFKGHMHMPLCAYIRHRRMERAAGMLQHSDQQVQKVAALVGYRSAAAFTREFSAHYGMPPSDWQREQRELAEHLPNAGRSAARPTSRQPLLPSHSEAM